MEDLSEGDVVWRQREYVVVEPLVMQEVHGVVHGGGYMKSRRNNVVGMRFESV